MENKKMIRAIAAAGFCSVLLCSAPAQAEDLLQLYQAALDGDPQLRSAQFDHQASQEVITQAWAGYRPSVNFDYQKVENKQKIISSDNTVYQGGDTSFPSTAWSLTISQPIFRYANYIRIGQAKTELRQADAELISAQQDLMLRVSEAYMQALAARDELGFLQAELNAAQRQLEQARGRENAAVGRKVDRYDAEARVASVEADYAAADIALRDAYEALYEMTGRDFSALSALRSSIDLSLPFPADEQYWLQSAITNNPALVAQREAVDVARQEVKRQNAGHFPTLDAEFRNHYEDVGGSLFGGASEVETQELTLRFNLPIYSGGSVSSQKREAVARYHSAEEELIRIMRDARRQSKETYWGVVNAVKRVKALQQAVNAQQATLDLRRESYKARIETAISVLDAERDLYSAKRDLSRAKYDYLINGLRLKALVGVLTQDDLILVNNWLKS
ncbi:TolC family outer membrane protein [Amphritea pacifica]|uniref:TolC family outer membrane protein n=1 Tax=Amphritea pacifica TaxID=2811233 RepID=A0ABS2W4B2_9GAMM|nr:TolC family outer membrane protein [Amphritea pacifica]MBN0986549.1 TolC family outer membrane protein [Amphritea pacifica]MBN1006126.1 TolC family outer membrane protein [Amphritea pacifica]